MPKGLKRALSALLITLFLYSLIGFLILPGVALRIANQQLAQLATVPASLQRLQLNPFSLELSLWGLRIGEAGQEHLGFQRLYANLELDSLWNGALHLAEVEPVSYTHLDVYKRQGSCRPAAWTPRHGALVLA